MADCHYVCFIYCFVFSHIYSCTAFLTFEKNRCVDERGCTTERRTKSISFLDNCSDSSPCGWIYYSAYRKKYDGHICDDSSHHRSYHWNVFTIYSIKCVHDALFKKSEVRLLEENQYDFIVRPFFSHER